VLNLRAEFLIFIVLIIDFLYIMFKILKRVHLISFLLLIFFSAQAQINDAQFWGELAVEKKIRKNFNIGLAQSVRFRQNISQLDKVFTELEAGYTFRKKISIGAIYRFEQEQKNEGYYSIRHRYAFDLEYKQKIKRFSSSIRTRFQSKYSDYYSSDEGKIPDNNLRFRLKTSYKIYLFPITPSISAEMFYTLNGKYRNSITSYRYNAEIKYKLNKNMDASLGYLIQTEKNVNNPMNIYAFVLGYSFDF